MNTVRGTEGATSEESERRRDTGSTMTFDKMETESDIKRTISISRPNESDSETSTGIRNESDSERTTAMPNESDSETAISISSESDSETTINISD